METGSDEIKFTRCKLIACATVMEEMRTLVPPTMVCQTLEAGLHVNPEKLRRMLQEAIDSAEPDIEVILLGYGLCSLSVVGLKSEKKRLVVPRVDDCTAIFLGSSVEYNLQHSIEPGTLYMSKGWIEGGAPLFEPEQMIKRFGEEKARSILKGMFRNYTRLVFIDTGDGSSESHRERSRHTAEQLDLRYEEIRGSSSILIKLLYGLWDDGFVVASPGKAISFSDFRQTNPDNLRKAP